MSEITTIRIQILGAEGFSLSGNSVHAEIARDDGEYVVRDGSRFLQTVMSDVFHRILVLMDTYAEVTLIADAYSTSLLRLHFHVLCLRNQT